MPLRLRRAVSRQVWPPVRRSVCGSGGVVWVVCTTDHAPDVPTMRSCGSRLMSGMGGRSASECPAPWWRLVTSRRSDLMASLTRAAARSPRDVSTGSAVALGERGAAEKRSRLDEQPLEMPLEIMMSRANGEISRNDEGMVNNLQSTCLDATRMSDPDRAHACGWPRLFEAAEVFNEVSDFPELQHLSDRRHCGYRIGTRGNIGLWNAAFGCRAPAEQHQFA